MTPLEWLHNTALERGLHNYAQWIEEHTEAAVAAGSEFVEAETAKAETRASELEGVLSAEKAHSAQIEQEMADDKAAWAAMVKSLADAGVTIGKDGGVMVALPADDDKRKKSNG